MVYQPFAAKRVHPCRLLEGVSLACSDYLRPNSNNYTARRVNFRQPKAFAMSDQLPDYICVMDGKGERVECKLVEVINGRPVYITPNEWVFKTPGLLTMLKTLNGRKAE